MDGLGLQLFFRVHRPGHRGIHLRQERKRALPGDRGDLREWSGEDPAVPGGRRRPAPIPGPGKTAHPTVRFWLYQKPDGKIATVFDACEICGAVGFYKSAMASSARIAPRPSIRNRWAPAGGCNPIPLKATQTADTIIIQEADLAAGSRVFAQP